MLPGHNGRLTSNAKVRYAVVGLGYISQSALLPAFGHAARNSVLTALVSGDSEKLTKLGRRYGVEHLYSYDEYDDCLRGGEVDAVYIGLPNHMHRDYAVRAAAAGVHVLCEKPMGVTEEDCLDMIRARDEHRVKLMIAYRLHFEAANLKAVELAQSGRLGEPRFFSSLFTTRVRDQDNIRLKGETGGGPLYDIGIYCINAARSVFRDEPTEVFASAVHGRDPRFREVPETVAAQMRYPGDRLASFTCSFGTEDASSYEVLGTRARLRVEPAYEIAEALKHTLWIDGRPKEKSFGAKDQFAPELLYFSRCILDGADPEPSGEEGLADVRIIRALLESIETGRPVPLENMPRVEHPSPRQRIDRPKIRRPRLVHANSPGEE